MLLYYNFMTFYVESVNTLMAINRNEKENIEAIKVVSPREARCAGAEI